MLYIDLILNLTLLIALSIVSGFIETRNPRPSLRGAVLQGFLFGAAALIGMFRPLHVGPGLIFDGRSVMISLVALYYGPAAALVPVLITGTTRILMGGSGTLMGILVILMSAATGLLFRRNRDRRGIHTAISGLELYLFGLAVHVQMVLLMVALPANLIVPTALRVGPPILMLYPFATVLAGKILSDQVSARMQLEALRESEQQFRDSLEFLPTPISIAAFDGSVIFMNRLFTETFGYTLDDIHSISEWSRIAYPDEAYRAQRLAVWEADSRAAVAANASTPPRIYAVTCSDGSVKQVEISMRPLGDRFLTVFQDMTGRLALETKLRNKVLELAATQEATINSMAILSEFRDSDTGAHILRTKLYVKLMLEKMGDLLPFPPEISELIWHSAPLHDIGKIAIPDSILLKQGRLSPEEFELMKKHVTYGSTAIRRTQESLPGDSFLTIASEIAEYHHEKWDGTGYPHGLAGNAIPMAARIMAIADVYDACITERPYKPPIPHEDVVRIISESSGTHFDPDLVRVFLRFNEDFRAIASEYRD
jgi:PAS domain S-box-containing protein